MLKRLFRKRKNKSDEFKTINVQEEPKIEENTCEIKITKENDYYIINVSTYASTHNFTTNEILNLISNNISWDNQKQKHKYGTYYIIKNNNEIYNILINDKEIRIDERIQFETYTHEKIITYDIEKNHFDYFQCKHDIYGSSYETLYYGSEDNGFFIKELELSKENTSSEINTILNNLSKYEFIQNIFDINSFSQIINEILNKKIELTLK